MTTVWLDAGDVAERLKVGRETARTIMQEMHHVVIGGTVRKRIRVSEAELEAWMAKKSVGVSRANGDGNFGSRKRLQRR